MVGFRRSGHICIDSQVLYKQQHTFAEQLVFTLGVLKFNGMVQGIAASAPFH